MANEDKQAQNAVEKPETPEVAKVPAAPIDRDQAIDTEKTVEPGSG